jgi:hypothetical protein
MYKTFRHGGKIGDVIFSLPAIRELGGGILYLPERTPDACKNLYSSLKDLLLLQPYIKEVREYPSGLPYMELAPDIHIDYDLDRARLQPLKGVVHIVKRYMDAFEINYPGWKEPWLNVETIPFRWSFWQSVKKGPYVLINYTGRHIKNDQMNLTSLLNWKNVIRSIDLPVYFVGLKSEWESFCDLIGQEMPHLRTTNMLELALLIKGAHSVYCNQSATLALAQSLGKNYYLEPKPMKRNCLLYTQNENILQ